MEPLFVERNGYMYRDFNSMQAAKMILSDVIKFNISFDDAWGRYNETWYNNTLSKKHKEETRNFILNVIESLQLNPV